MDRDETERLWALVRRLQRAPEALDDIEARRALTVLTASRSDAAYLLLQRVLVLELALDRIREQSAGAGADARADARPVEGRGGPAPLAAVRRRPSPFLRDAAVIAAGVVGGGLVLDALDGLDAGGLDDAAGSALSDIADLGGLG